MNWTVWLNVCVHDCNRWNAHVYRARNNYLSFSTSQQNNAFPYDKYEPIWNCRSKERLPARGGDGPKFICGLASYETSTDCIFSLGSNGDTQFEDAIHHRLPGMKIVTVDPTLTEAKKKTLQHKKHIHFLDIWVGSESIKNKKYESRSLQHLLEQYNPVSIIKMDIEGSEHIVFTRKLSCDVLKDVDQVLIEIHMKTQHSVDAIFRWFSNCNMLLYSKEPNIWGCAGRYCGEYSFISPKFAYREYMASR